MANRQIQGDDDDYNYLNNSNAGSTAMLKNKTGGGFEVTGTHADFERDPDVDLNE